MTIRNCTPADIDQVRQLVNICKPLGLHRKGTYWVLFTYFNDSCFVLEKDKKIVGFISGLKSTSQKGVFHIWQIGVLQLHRGQGHAYRLLTKILARAKELKCDKIQFTIEVDNDKSLGLFTKFAQKNHLSIKKLYHISYYDSLSGERENEDAYEYTI